MDASRDDDDRISITSTIDEENDPDEDWDVNRVLAEGPIDDEIFYLIEWTGFPLSDASWEPPINIGDDILADWEVEKQARKNGTATKFRISNWKAAVREKIRAKQRRHKARNRKRRRLGLETTYKPSLEEELQYIDEYPSDTDSEADPVLVRSRRAVPDTRDTAQTSTKTSSSHSGTTPRQETSEQNPPPVALASQASANELVGDDHGMRPPAPGSAREQALHAPGVVSPPLSSRPQPPRRQSSDVAGLLGRRPPATTPTSKQPASPAAATEKPAAAVPQVLPRRNFGVGVDNVFSGGKVRKKRSTLLEAAVNSSKRPQFLKSRHQRLIEKGFRDKEGTVAPARLPSKTISLGRYHQSWATAKTDGNPSEPAASSPDTAAQAEDEPTTKAKKRKSVHWDDDVRRHDAMDVDSEDSLFVPDPSPLPGVTTSGKGTRLGSPPPPSKLSPGDSLVGDSPKDDSQNPASTRSITKMTRVGLVSGTLGLIFHGIPDGPDRHWVSKFNSSDSLTFGHTCTAQDFLTQSATQSVLWEERLGDGTVSSITHQTSLETLADRLRIGSLGIFSYHEDYCVLIRPTKCEDWQTEGSVGSGMVAPNGHPLRFSIYKASTLLVPSMLAPIQPPAAASNHAADVVTQTTDPRSFGGVTYADLIPSNVADAKDGVRKPHFFLAFPRPNEQEALLLSQWLRLSDPACMISASTFPGHWASFAMLDRGIVILHEDAVWTTRRFPGVVNLLHKSPSKFGFWLFTRALQPSPMFDTLKSNIGELCLSRVLPCGMAILMTPSFFVTQPEQAYAFVKWFRKNHPSMPGFSKLIACAGIAEWLSDLAVEKHSSQGDSSAQALPKEQRIVEARLKTSYALRDVILEARNDTFGPVLCAPEMIDGNDEQSLVNWFGQWSILNMDRVRAFSVLGSGDLHSKRTLSRRIKTPRYHPDTSDDPDQVEARTEAGQRSGVQTNPEDSSTQMGPKDSARVLEQRLQSLLIDVQKGGWCPVRLYKGPVSYWTSDMAYSFMDYHSEFATFTNWFRSFNSTGTKRHNTFAGFFYTFNGRWDPGDPSPGQNSDRSPWVAFYRPVDPHKHWERTELLIWDLESREKFKGTSETYEEDLAEGQRRLIKCVRDLSEEVNLKLPLSKVWLGGFEHLPSSFVHPIDITFHNLGVLMRDLKAQVPAPASMLPGRGWRLVREGARPPGAKGEPMDVDEQALVKDAGAGGDTDLKMVCHPPRGNGGTGPRKCKNRFFQAAKEAESQGRDEFQFTFRPTMEWYLEQLGEGRGFEHIRVASWEATFREYKIADPEAGVVS